MNQSRASIDENSLFDIKPHLNAETKENCLRTIKNMDSIDFFAEPGPRSRLNALVAQLEPIFEKIAETKMGNIEDIFQQSMIKVKSLEVIRRDTKSTEISFVDQADQQYIQSQKKRGFKDMLHPVCLTDKKVSSATSSPLAFQSRWMAVDKELRQNHIIQINQIIKQSFKEFCKQLLIEHPMFESALQQIFDLENKNKNKVTTRRKTQTRTNTMGMDSWAQNTSANAASGQTSTDPPQPIVNIHLNLKSYKEHSNKIKEICQSYDSLLEENERLRKRIKALKQQYNKETNIAKHTQFFQADKDMKLLQEYRLKRSRERNGGIQDRGDDTLDDYENKIVPVEFFNSLEGLDPDLQQELNHKLAKVRNQFQEILDLNLRTVDKLNNKIKLLNDLSPDSYSVANLSMVELFMGCAKKERDPARVWKALLRAYGKDYFITVVEEQYGKRFVNNYNALYEQVNEVKQQADKEIVGIEEVCKDEVRVHVRSIQDLRQEVAVYRENFREQIIKIQNDTKKAMEKDFEHRESEMYQDHIHREAELQREIDDRDHMYSESFGELEKLKKRMFLERLKFVALAKQVPLAEDPMNGMLLQKILGFLRGETCNEKEECVKPLNLRIQELKDMNSDLLVEVRKLDLKNSMLEIQMSLLDGKTANICDKITSAENKQLIAYEEKRKAMLDLRASQLVQQNLESIIESHEKEKMRLICELKRFTKGKLRSNMLEAELYRKEKQNQIVKRAVDASKACYVNVQTVKACQTNISGLKQQLVQLSGDQYQEKFCKQFVDSMVQTDHLLDSGSGQNTNGQNTNGQNTNGQNTSRNIRETSRNNSSAFSFQKRTKTDSKTKLYLNAQNSQAEPKSINRSKREDRSSIQRSSKMNTGSQRTNARADEAFSQVSHSMTTSLLGGQNSSINNKLSQRKVFDVGTTCDLLQNPHLYDIAKLNDSTLPTSTKRNSHEHQKLTNYEDGTKIAAPRLRRNSSHKSLLASPVRNKSQDRMATLAELYPDEQLVTDEDGFVDIPVVGFKQLITDHTSNEDNSKKEQPKSQEQKQRTQAFQRYKTNNTLLDNRKHAVKLNEAWQLIKNRLAAIDVQEKRNNSQIKYEVDKAFEMAKYFSSTNMNNRDPATIEAYNRIVQLCITRLDQLTPVMILQKLEEEINELQKYLPNEHLPSNKKNNQSNVVGKILNFVCLENLNKQIVRIFNVAIKETLASSPVTSSYENTKIRSNEMPSFLLNRPENINRNSINIIESNYDHPLSKNQDEIMTLAQTIKSETPQNMLRNFVVSQPLQPESIGFLSGGIKMINHSTAAKIARNQLMRSQTNISSSVLQPLPSKEKQYFEDCLPRRRSLESILTIKSTQSNQRGTKSQMENPLNYVLDGSDDSSTDKKYINENIMRQLSLKSNKTLKKNRVVNARQNFGKQFASKGFQSLLTLSKLQPGPLGSLGHRNTNNSSDKKLKASLFREKMSQYMNQSSGLMPQQTSQNTGGAGSSLFKQPTTAAWSDYQSHSRARRLEDQEMVPDTDQIINELDDDDKMLTGERRIDNNDHSAEDNKNEQKGESQRISDFRNKICDSSLNIILTKQLQLETQKKDSKIMAQTHNVIDNANTTDDEIKIFLQNHDTADEYNNTEKEPEQRIISESQQQQYQEEGQQSGGSGLGMKKSASEIIVNIRRHLSSAQQHLTIPADLSKKMQTHKSNLHKKGQSRRRISGGIKAQNSKSLKRRANNSVNENQKTQ